MPIDVVTTKDEDSVALLLDEYGVRDKVGSVFGRTALAIFRSKGGAMLKTCRDRRIAPAQTAYINYHLEYLADVRATGVRLWYAVWGCSNPTFTEIPADVRVATFDRAHEMLGRA